MNQRGPQEEDVDRCEKVEYMDKYGREEYVERVREEVEQRKLVDGHINIRIVVREVDNFWVGLCIQVRCWLYWIWPRVGKTITELDLLSKEMVIMK